MKANLPKREPAIQKLWDERRIYHAIQEKNKDRPLFLLHDGPPYANGNIHMGHALNKILKDIIVKFKSLQGWRAPFIPGWDCHGLPIEYQLFKELGQKKKEVGQIEFRKKAARFAQKFIEIQKEEFRRLGVFGDWDNPYITMDPRYEVKIIETFKALFRKGYIYQSKKPVYWCSTCETALAEAEVEYMEKASPSIYVKFGVLRPQFLTPVEPAHALIWTTTPWTLPANLALAFHPDHLYALVITKVKGREELLIIAHELVTEVMDKMGLKDYRIHARIKGEVLKGQKFSHPFVKREVVGILGDFVSMEEGTGIVHIAPGHGMEDYQIGLKYNLEIFAPVDSKGHFTQEAGEFFSLHVFDANRRIIEKLRNNGALIYEEDIRHSYPHCWRCKQPIVFRATEQWFMKIEKNFREDMLENIRKVKWIPGAGEKRISGMVEQRPDWCLSRQRYWGVPLPIVYCSSCRSPLPSPASPEDVRVINSFQKIVETEGTDAWFKKEISDILPPGTTCKHCGGSDFYKENDILDVWFDSGVSHEAVLKVREELEYPADLYLEGSDQHRGWFQTSLIPAVALDNTAPYRTVLTHGFVVDGEGRKMSKSLGNVIAPQEIISSYGADILRLWVASENYRMDMKISREIISHLVDAYRKIRNTFRYLLGNLYDFYPSRKIKYHSLLEIDRYMLYKLQILIEESRKGYEEYEFHRVFHMVYHFCTVELSSFYLDVLKDRLYTSGSDSLPRRSAQTVLYDTLYALSLILAPLLSHTAEEVWTFMPGEEKEESVFLASYPQKEPEYIDEELGRRWKRILSIRELATKAMELSRAERVIGNSLEAKVLFFAPDPQEFEFVQKYNSSWKEILIVSQVEIRSESPPEGAVRNSENSGLAVKVMRAEGGKCPRCWNYHLSVNTEGKLCVRCQEVIRQYYHEESQ